MGEREKKICLEYQDDGKVLIVFNLLQAKLSMFQAPFIREDQASQRAVKIIEQTFLGKTIKIQITDGRTFEGRFVCVDSEMNVILQGAYEYSTSDIQNTIQNALEPPKRKRWAGMVMIPGLHITNVDIKQHLSLNSDEGIYG